MNKPIKYLGMFLDSPLQSWGYQSRFDQRTTLSYPTKSGILGILCAAMGIPKTDTKRLSELTNLSMQSYSLVRNERPNERPIRRIKDFHTVGGGYAYPQERQNISPKADGSKGDTVVTNREYLMDAKYAIILGGNESLIGNIGKYLKNPVWGVWCGRKSCIPAASIFQGIYNNADETIQKIIEATNTRIIRKIVEVENFEEGTDSIRDVPVDFLKREFMVRRIADNPV
ncbi:MAG: CRISPR system Cascade subunit CasD [Candidatus Scalindua rubra]|uniref:CRISPR system Cascade subunit CasD n=1 Tax=Candidatus Scalindua rubra TaxID=1872076 RepID=A0A1E3X6I5_9BACT|nr:MAG: CRISPR system Cascade subunit CasD [Candidatus Scalindua rubra]